MKIIRNKTFEKQYEKLPKNKQRAADAAIALFAKNPHEKSLRNHALSGTKKGLHSINAGFDLRILFVEKENYVLVIMMEVGTHSQLYK